MVPGRQVNETSATAGAAAVPFLEVFDIDHDAMICLGRQPPHRQLVDAGRIRGRLRCRAVSTFVAGASRVAVNGQFLLATDRWAIRFGDVGAVAAESFKDLVSGFVPDERFGVVVPVCEPFDDVFGEGSTESWAERCRFLVVSVERREPSLDEVHPTTRRSG